MITIPLATWIANAAAGLTGLYGDATRQAGRADCSRQTVYDHARKVQAAVAAAHDGGADAGPGDRTLSGPPSRECPALGLARPDHRIPPGQPTRVRRHRRGDGIEPQP